MKYLLTLSFLVLGACGHDKVCTQTPPPPYGKRLLTFGDSQTAGRAWEIDNCPYSWANVVAKNRHLDLINLAVPATVFPSADQFGRIMDFEYRPTDEVGMLIGYNDMADYGTDPDRLGTFKADLAQALAFVAPKVSVVVVGTCLVPPSIKGQASIEATDLYRQATRDVAAAAGFPNVVVVDVDDSFAGQPAAYGPDVWHLSNASQDVVAGVMMAAGL